MTIAPINFVDAPPGWSPGDALPPGATPINASALTLIQTNAGSYVDTQIGLLGVTANVFGNTTAGQFDTRPAARVVLWIGGGPGDDPFILMHNGDIWVPSSLT
jgi:hypothetical protein